MPKDNTPLGHVRDILDSVHDWQGHEGSTDATRIAELLEAQIIIGVELVERQSRIAHEAETANLLAYLNAAASRSLRCDPSESVLKSVQASIEERLGLS
ncbi:hypothetical protein SEA_JINKIES_74 [Arthrobacter phage Jinkies]|uniref:Uncharacterized protein n=1 Tax=Arthrobacter phage Jinkies TaxID=2743903 RepID=A0A7T0IFI0_9CAUD|nr:hypothetical protein SEA_JINKIES_74 [Arthrobacter phage Jinkies]